ncbi:MAG TPA: hypothetical protein VNE21_05900 [Mycobacteriales bacterium]|nr:hypothetical protein [Mycobacteriales bacterium]
MKTLIIGSVAAATIGLAGAAFASTSASVGVAGQVSGSAGPGGVQACASASATVNGQGTAISQCTP